LTGDRFGLKARFETFVEDTLLEGVLVKKIQAVRAIRHDERMVDLPQRTQVRCRYQRRRDHG
jgi:hypothetical protein